MTLLLLLLSLWGSPSRVRIPTPAHRVAGGDAACAATHATGRHTCASLSLRWAHLSTYCA